MLALPAVESRQKKLRHCRSSRVACTGLPEKFCNALPSPIEMFALPAVELPEKLIYRTAVAKDGRVARSGAVRELYIAATSLMMVALPAVDLSKKFREAASEVGDGRAARSGSVQEYRRAHC